jgi:hypothetical protein
MPTHIAVPPSCKNTIVLHGMFSVNNLISMFNYRHFIKNANVIKCYFPEQSFSFPVLWHCEAPEVMLSYNLTISNLLEQAVGRLKRDILEERVYPLITL